jgi:uracil-DNA glycosylase
MTGAPDAPNLRTVTKGVSPQPLGELVDPAWAVALAPVADQIAAMGDFLRAETKAGRRYLPEGKDVLRAFTNPFADVRVLIVGQDPYPTPGHPVGLSFSVERDVFPVPRSLQNIYRELHDDLDLPVAEHGDLTLWENRGVLLLNRVLTVQAGNSGSHRGKGWEAITERAVTALVARGTPLVAILWGRDAAALKPLLGSTPTISSAHPSPLSASNGFFGSRPFSRANDLLVQQGAAPVDWSLQG